MPSSNRPLPHNTTHLLIEEINKLLPQWQCQRCEYEDCRDYARAIEGGEAINRCPPGGTVVLSRLQSFAREVLQRSPEELAQQWTINPDLDNPEGMVRAEVVSEACIGCARCIPACPLGAIIGGKKTLALVLAESCSGCGLCLPVCPMDCIDMKPVADWKDDDERREIFYAHKYKRDRALQRQQPAATKKEHLKNLAQLAWRESGIA